ncbi:ArsR family transcriptional regulator [Leptospira kobayashii]|uniref:ArsR family transcriptional regulator n=1 Tax=Leptospira kobayashii TaxID=1917830 RepID=A0ABN6KPB5_9LEPT|nr:metalloregulator ArsR/SmtB family transcription factor [Leptospira kobayashii]BDA80910.1 ArsR family transcriptional regulator [Leptospira kobayashii]
MKLGTYPQPSAGPRHILPALKAVSDETRVRILHILSFGSFSVNEIVEILSMGQSRISRHLKILTDAGLISSRREGSLVYSSLPEDPSKTNEGSTEIFSNDLTHLILSYKEDLPDREKDQRMVSLILEGREKKSKVFFDRVAAEWESIQEESLNPKLYRSWIIENLPTNSHQIVDLGCGPGGLIPYLLPKSKMVLGIDSSPKMIELAHTAYGNNPSVKLAQAQLESLPISDETCEAVVGSMVLHHISHPPTVLEEIHRVLKPGGVFCLVDLEKHNQEFMRDNFADLWLGFDKDVLESWLINANFEIESENQIQTDSIFKILTIKARKKGGQYVHSN